VSRRTSGAGGHEEVASPSCAPSFGAVETARLAATAVRGNDNGVEKHAG